MNAIDIDKVKAQIREGEVLNNLIQQKNDLLRNLIKIENEILVINSKNSSSLVKNNDIEESAPSMPTQTTQTQSTITSRRGRKPKGELSLANRILLLVEGNSEGLDRFQIVQLLLKSGYQSGSKKFADVVASTLSSLKGKSRIKVNEAGKFISMS